MPAPKLTSKRIALLSAAATVALVMGASQIVAGPTAWMQVKNNNHIVARVT